MKLRKIPVIIAATLLFCIFTGIIILKAHDKPEAIESFIRGTQPQVLIIDAGHGGADGGAVASNGTTESIINIAIAAKLNSLASCFGIETLMTREDATLPYPAEADTIAKKKRWDQQRRLELINSTGNAVFISIHQNKYPDPRPFGPQVLYGRNDGSKELGEYCHELLNACICPENRRVASQASDDIYLMKNANCPAILVECGFMSNEAELIKLCDDCYQKKLAVIILTAYLGFVS